MWTGRPATKLSQGPVLVTIGPGGGTAALAFCCRSICFSLSLSAFTLPLCSSISDRRLFMALISAFSSLISSALTDVAASAVIAATTVPASRHRDNVLNVAGVCFLGMAPPDSQLSRNRLISSMSPPPRVLLLRSGTMAALAVRTLSSRSLRRAIESFCHQRCPIVTSGFRRRSITPLPVDQKGPGLSCACWTTLLVRPANALSQASASRFPDKGHAHDE